jgi:transcriptional regulator with XRE-family HTH domain
MKYKREKEKFGKSIRKIRLAQGLTQEELAHKAQIERSYMGFIERGQANPSFEKIIAISKALNVSWAKLIS